MTSKPYQLFYWPIPGRAEAARVALSLANLDWEDVSMNRELFATMKSNGDLPWGMVPFLKTPEVVLRNRSPFFAILATNAI